MSGATGIEWTDATWNPVVGCEKVSQGCKFCYAKSIHDLRHKAYHEGKEKIAPQYAQPFETVQLMPDRLSWPLSLQKPSRIFVNSVSDLFHENVPFEFIAQVFAVMSLATRHQFQVLTKRPARMREFFDWVAREGHGLAEEAPEPWDGTNVVTHHAIIGSVGNNRRFQRAYDAVSDSEPAPWPLPNVWLGVSVENQKAADERIPLLIQTPAAIRWLSCEPLLGPIDFTPPEYRGTNVNDWLQHIDWVVVGGESSANKKQAEEVRPLDPNAARGVRDACVNRTDMGRPWPLPFLFKQWGDYVPASPHSSHVSRVGKKKAGRMLDGRLWDEYPAVRS